MRSEAESAAKPVFRELAEASRGGATSVVAHYLAHHARIEDAWLHAPGLKADLRLGGAQYPVDLLSVAAVVFDAVAAHSFVGGAQRVEWLTREGLVDSLGRAEIELDLAAAEADRLLRDARDPLLRIGVALRDDAESAALFGALEETASRGRLWLRPRRVALVNAAAGPAQAPNWRLRDVDSASLREVWTPVPAGATGSPAFPVRFGPTSGREREVVRLTLSFPVGLDLSALDRFLLPLSEDLARCRTAFELAMSEILRRGTLSPRLLEDLLKLEWERWDAVLEATLETEEARRTGARLARATVAFVAPPEPRTDATLCVLRRGRAREAEIAYDNRPDDRPARFLWRCWGVQTPSQRMGRFGATGNVRVPVISGPASQGPTTPVESRRAAPSSLLR
jgi:hypothetical protein